MATLDFTDRHLVRGMPYSADLFNGTVYSDVVSMKRHHVAEFNISIELGSTGTATITVQACDDVVPTNRSPVEFYVQKVTGSDDVPGAITAVASTGFVTTAGATAQIYRLMVDGQALGPSGYDYVQLKAVEVVNDPVAGSVMIHLSKARYKDAIPASAIV